MAKKKDTQQAQSFEENLGELEQIVASLEKAQAPLEEQLKAFEKGVSLSRKCTKELEQIERKVEKIIENAQGQLKAQPLESDASSLDH